MASCNLAYTPGAGKGLSLGQPEKNCSQRGKATFPGYHGQHNILRRGDLRYDVNKLAWAMSKPSEAHFTAAKHLLRYLSVTTESKITYKQGGFNPSTFSGANWGNNPDNGKLTSSYLAFVLKSVVSFKMGLQGLTVRARADGTIDH